LSHVLQTSSGLSKRLPRPTATAAVERLELKHTVRDLLLQYRRDLCCCFESHTTANLTPIQSDAIAAKLVDRQPHRES